MAVNRRLDTGTLTPEQISDCYRDGRLPSSGKKYRTSGPTGLEKRCKEVNWAKLMITGAVRNMAQASNLCLLDYGQRTSLSLTLSKLETLLLNTLAEGYEAFKAEELYKRDTDRAFANQQALASSKK